MGIIVRDKVSKQITFYMKGADVVMSKIVKFNDWLDEECGNMARWCIEGWESNRNSERVSELLCLEKRK